MLEIIGKAALSFIDGLLSILFCSPFVISFSLGILSLFFSNSKVSSIVVTYFLKNETYTSYFSLIYLIFEIKNSQSSLLEYI